MPEPVLQVPLPIASDIPAGVPHMAVAGLDAALAAAVTRPVVEPLASFDAHLDSAMAARLTLSHVGHVNLPLTRDALPSRVSHRQWQTTFVTSQGQRGSCWAFAGCAALEAAYARAGVQVHLSPHYLFHISKAYQNHQSGPGFTSLVGFQGAADIVRLLWYWAVPISDYVPYIDQPALQQIANAIPGTGGVLTGSGGGTRDQDDWFEFDLRHVPLMGRWFAQYRMRSYGAITNFTTDDIRRTLAAGYDVVVNVNDQINNGGHVLLIYGYDDQTQTFEIKNSQSLPGFATMKYTGDAQFDIKYSSMYFISEVQPVQAQWAAMWVGRWETDHDGWRGRLTIRRFCDINSGKALPVQSAPISLGAWTGEDGRVLDVVGYFVCAVQSGAFLVG